MLNLICLTKPVLFSLNCSIPRHLRFLAIQEFLWDLPLGTWGTIAMTIIIVVKYICVCIIHYIYVYILKIHVIIHTKYIHRIYEYLTPNTDKHL